MTRRAAADVTVGEELPGLEVTITRETLVKYAGASGDFNVIHWDEPTARGVGLPDVIAHGMLTMALAGRVVTDWAGDPAAVVEYGTRFSGMVPVPHGTGAVLTVGGTVEEVLDGGRVVVGLTATVGGGAVLRKARAVVQLS